MFYVGVSDIDCESMLEFPGGRGNGGIRCLGEYVGNVCGKCGRCVGKGEVFVQYCHCNSGL